MNETSKYKIILIGASSGGGNAIRRILKGLIPSFSLPIVIVLHLSPQTPSQFTDSFQKETCATVSQANWNDSIIGGNIYFAPPDYHLLIEADKTFAFSKDEKVHYSRPAIDVLFESAADAYGKSTVGIILTGANQDGAKGLLKVKEHGGLTIVQDPQTAEMATMPEFALEKTSTAKIMTIDQIIKKLNIIGGKPK